jgi:hypothetical protein
LKKIKLNKPEPEPEVNVDKSNESVQWVINNIPIDRFELEIEGEKQTQLMQKMTNLHAKVIARKKEYELQLENLEIQLANKVRHNPKKHGLTKDTDGTVFKYVRTLPEYHKLFKQYLFVLEKEEQYKSIVKALVSRGSMIKILAELWLNNYYAEPVNYKKTTKPALRPNADSQTNLQIIRSKKRIKDDDF